MASLIQPALPRAGKVHYQRHQPERTPLYNWSYIGPGGNTLTGFNPTTGAPIITANGSWRDYRSAHNFDMGTTNAFTTPNMPPVVDLNSIANLIQEHVL